MPVLVWKPFAVRDCLGVNPSAVRRFNAAAIILLITCFLHPTSVLAAGRLSRVHLIIAGKALVSNVSPVADDTEVYAPLEVLKAVDAIGHLSPHGDTVIVSEKSTGRTLELALARVNGSEMIALSDLGHVVDGVVIRSAAHGVIGPAPNTIYFAARISNIKMDGNHIQIETSFPVQYRSSAPAVPSGLTSFVDCDGAVLDGYRPTQQIVGLSTVQLSESLVRVEVSLPIGVMVAPNDSGGLLRSFSAVFVPRPKVVPVLKSTLPTAEGLLASGQAPGAALDDPSAIASHNVVVLAPGERSQSPLASPGGVPSVSSRTGSSTQVMRTNPPLVRNAPPGPGVVGGTGGNVLHQEPGDPVPAVTGGVRPTHPVIPAAKPVEIRSLTFNTDDASRARIELQVSSKAGAVVRYVPGTTQMEIDIANAVINVPDQDSCDREIQHPLVNHLAVATIPGQPNKVRVQISTSRIVGYTLNSQTDRITLDLRMPRNATGALSDKLIVVDAGHGGAATGASGHAPSGTIYEKTITLAIAMRLRTLLEQCGARVVVTRDSDVDIPLYDRPKLANTIGADLFISIHNDSTPHLNSASGTTTYYHSADPSSRALAVCVQDAVHAVTGLPSKGALSDSVLYASGLAVLRNSTMPAVLCEVAYINNDGDRSKLVEPAFQQRVAQAMCDGLRSYVEGRPRPSSRQLQPEVSSPGSVTVHGDDPTH